MKIQDIVFIAFFLFLIFKRNPRLCALFGILALFVSIPLFAEWIFFTAERLTWYAAAFFLLCVVQHLLHAKYNEK